MNRVVFLISFLMFHVFVAASTLTGDKNEFAGIPFGMDRETVIEEILKLGYEPYGMAESSDRIVIPVFMMGELPVQVDFLFNRNEKFYSFEIRTGRIEAARMPKVFEAASYMGEQFNLKYGAPGKSNPLQEANLREGLNLYEEWFSVRLLNVFTAIVSKDGRFYTIGSVTHRVLSGEKAQKQKSSAATSAKKAAF
jgi:hypothetical protein